MFEQLNTLCLTIMDPVMNWLLRLPRDVVLVILAFSTAFILTIVRVFTTDQNRLKRCKLDKDRLKQLVREAKQKYDKEAVARYHLTVNQIGLVTLKAEWKPLLVSLVPIALLATWAFSRVAYQAPHPGDTVAVKAYFGLTGIGQTAHLCRQDGLEVEGGQWVQPIQEDLDPATGKPAGGLAEWTVRLKQRAEPYVLKIRYQGDTYEKEAVADGLRYADKDGTMKTFEGDALKAVQLDLPPYKFLKVVPGLPAYNLFYFAIGDKFPWVSFASPTTRPPPENAAGIGGPPWMPLDPWIVGYLVIVFPLAFVLKPVLRIY